MTWSLVTYRRAADPWTRAGVLTPDGTIRHHRVLDDRAGVLDVITRWAEDAPALRDLDPYSAAPVPDATLDQPLLHPRKVICAGANYPDHLREMGQLEVPDGFRPYFFLVPPTTALIGDGASIELPADSVGADYEAELAVVIGRRASNVTPAQARDHVAGYTVFNDVTARRLLQRDVALAPPFAFDWLGAKGGDTFSPLGPGIVPHWLIPDPHALKIQLWHNGALKQDGHTSQMIFDVWELIAAASSLTTLEPGDVLATGTPAGVGVAQGLELRAGDVVTVEIESVGRLTNPVSQKELVA